MKLGWIDFSRNERNKIIQTLELLNKPTALDELGIGVVRDAYADILFPGISTLQTRAKYFLLIPYIFSMSEREKFKRLSEVLQWIHKQEDSLVPTLIKNSKNTNGIIGSRANKQDKSVKTKPSSIYWNGMRTFEILRDEHLSISNVCNNIYSKQIRKNSVEIKTESKSKDGEGFDDETAMNENMQVFSNIPLKYPVMTDGEIELTKEEADFLYEKITTAKNSRNSLLAFILREKRLFSSFDAIDENILPEDLKSAVRLAKDFAGFIEGAHIRYNVIFSNSEDKNQMDKYGNWLKIFDFKGFDLSAVLSNVENCNFHLYTFLKNFYDAAKSRNNDAVDRLIVEREKAIKQDRAKLHNQQEYRYEPVHDYKLNYRYGYKDRSGGAYMIIKDILNGMKR